MLNRITLMGRLTRDPELRQTQSGTSVASFTLACDRDFAAQGAEKETDFIDVVAWRNTAEIVAESVYFGDSKRDGQNASAAAPASAEFKPLPSTTPVPFSSPDMPQMEIGDDELPF